MIYDLDDFKLQGREVRLDPAGTLLFQIRADCYAGKKLRATAAESCTVSGRIKDFGAFVDLTVAGLDTSLFAGERKTFEIRIQAFDVAFALENIVFEVKK